MCPDWWLNTALVGSAVRTLTETIGKQGVASGVGTVLTADPTGFHQSEHIKEAQGRLGGDQDQGRLWSGFHRYAVSGMLVDRFLGWPE